VRGVNITSDRKVSIRDGFDETKLREHVKMAGCYWDSEKKAWQLSYQQVLTLGLDRLILDEELGF
jgi:hypothetical protein